MKGFLYLVVLLVLTTGSFAQNVRLHPQAPRAVDAQRWVNGSNAPRLRVVDEPGRVLPPVRNCNPQPQQCGSNRSNNWVTAAYLLQVLAAAQQGNCQSFGFVPQGYSYTQPYAIPQGIGYGYDPAAAAFEEGYQTRLDQLLRQQRDQRDEAARNAGRRTAEQQLGF